MKLTRRLALPLTVLAAAPGRVVPRAHLVERCWPASDVGDESLSRAIADLRKTFRREQYEVIESVYGIGYRLKLPDASREDEAVSRRAASFRDEAKLRVHDRRRSTLETAEYLFGRAIGEQASPEDWVGIAGLQVHKMQLGYARGSEAYSKLQHAIENMQELERASALVFRAVACCWEAQDFDAAADLLDAARKLDPGAYLVNHFSGIRAVSVGDFEEAQAHFRRAAQARPAALQPYGWRALALAYGGDEKEALATLGAALEIDDSGPLSRIYSTWIHGLCGLSAPSLDAARRSYDALPDSPNVRALLATALASCSRETAARELLASRTSDGMLVGECTMAVPAWLALSESGLALASLQHGLQERCPWLAILMQDPRCSVLQGSPEFLSISRTLRSAASKIA